MCVVVLIGILLFQLFLFFTAPQQIDKSFLSLSLTLNACVVGIVFFGVRKTLKKKWFTGLLLFILSFCIVHFQLYFEYLRDLVSAYCYHFYDPRYACKACALSSVGLSVFCITYLSVARYFEFQTTSSSDRTFRRSVARVDSDESDRSTFHNDFSLLMPTLRTLRSPIRALYSSMRLMRDHIGSLRAPIQVLYSSYLKLSRTTTPDQLRRKGSSAVSGWKNSKSMSIKSPMQPIKSTKRNQRESSPLGRVLSKTILFRLIVVFFLLYYFTTDRLYFQGGYTDYKNVNGPDGYVSLLLLTFIGLYVLSASLELKSKTRDVSIKDYFSSLGIRFFIVTILFSYLVFSSGDRGPVVTIFCYFFVGFAIARSESPPLLMTVGVGVLLAFIVLIIGNVRGNTQTGASNFQKMGDAISDDNIYGESNFVTSELAWSVFTLHLSVAVREKGESSNGKMLISEALNCIPLLGSKLTKLFSLNYGNADYFLTKYYFGENPKWGVGSSTLCDFYLDFGVLGVILGMIVIGVHYSICDFCLYGSSRNIYTYVFVFFTIARTYYLGRSVYLNVLREVVIVCVVVYLFSRLMKKENAGIGYDAKN